MFFQTIILLHKKEHQLKSSNTKNIINIQCANERERERESKRREKKLKREREREREREEKRRRRDGFRGTLEVSIGEVPAGKTRRRSDVQNIFFLSPRPTTKVRDTGSRC